MRTTTQEALWVLRAQSDDCEALELLLRSVQPSLRRYVLGLVGTVKSRLAYGLSALRKQLGNNKRL